MDINLLKKARLHLQKSDDILRPLVKKIGACTIRVNGDHFDLLVRAIVSQQISTKAADAISARLLAKVKRLQAQEYPGRQ